MTSSSTSSHLIRETTEDDSVLSSFVIEDENNCFSSPFDATLIRFDDNENNDNDEDLNCAKLSTSKTTPDVTRFNDDTLSGGSPRRTQYRVIFEIISAKTMSRSPGKSSGKKYVSYTILVKRVPGLETNPGVIERRYSEFLTLYQSLRKRFPSLLTDFPFPKKTLMGNFNADVIRERSVAFQHLLAYCLSINELRTTREFNDFLFHRELKEAQRFLKNTQFEEASNLLENIYFIQEKLSLFHAGEANKQLFQTLCVLIACLNAVDNTVDALKYAEKAIELISTNNHFDTNELIVPLIVLSIKLRWTSGQQKSELEQKLRQFKQKGVSVDKQPTLLELILKKDFISANN